MISVKFDIRSNFTIYGVNLTLECPFYREKVITKINNDYYAYDGINRLTWYGNKPLEQATTANGTRWTYDGAGNISSKEKVLNGAGQGVTSFGYDLANRLWSMGATTYTNDSRGSRTQKTNGDTWNYTFDGGARLTQVTKNGVTQVQNVFDGNGLRVKKVENGKTTYYINSGVNPLMEYSAIDGSYLFRIYAGNQAIAEDTNGIVKYLHKDHLGSTRIVTNTSGVKIAEYKFTPYGEMELSTGNGTEYGFTDKADDDSTGLDYFGFRFYDPEVGRFITQDPIKAGNNWFSYCNDNPINFIDPDGLMLDDAGSADGWAHRDDGRKKDDNRIDKDNSDHFKKAGDLAIAGLAISQVDSPAIGPADVVGAMLLAGAAQEGLKGLGELISDAIDTIKSAFASKNKNADSSQAEAPSIPKDATQAPGPDWEWRGKGAPGSNKGSWVNPKTGETFHPDMNHPGPIGPHYDYKTPNGDQYRVYPDGRVVPK